MGMHFHTTLRSGLFCAALVAGALAPVGPAGAQSMSLQDFAAQVDSRSGTLNGFRTYLTDPDPLRAMAALQIMLESGDPTLIRMALSVGIYSADPDVRQTALKAFLAGKPSLDLFLDGSEVPDDSLETYNRIMRGFGGSVGIGKTGSISRQVGERSEEMGCWTDLNQPSECLMRVNATTVSLYLSNRDSYVPSQWVHLTLDESGALSGGLFLTFNGQNIAPVPISMRLSE